MLNELANYCVPDVTNVLFCIPIQDVFHVYLNKLKNAVTHLFLVIFGNN